MSDQDENESNITALFPTTRDDAEEGDEESRASEEDTPEQSRSEDSSSDDNVVRLQFGKPKESLPVAPPLEELSEKSRAKLALFEKLIDQGMVMVTLDPTNEEVVVPGHLRGSKELRLNFCYRFQLPDFAFDTRGVRGSLSFQGVRQFCEIPWEAVFMLFSHESGEAYLFDPEASS